MSDARTPPFMMFSLLLPSTRASAFAVPALPASRMAAAAAITNFLTLLLIITPMDEPEKLSHCHLSVLRCNYRLPLFQKNVKMLHKFYIVISHFFYIYRRDYPLQTLFFMIYLLTQLFPGGGFVPVASRNNYFIFRNIFESCKINLKLFRIFIN